MIIFSFITVELRPKSYSPALTPMFYSMLYIYYSGKRPVSAAKLDQNIM